MNKQLKQGSQELSLAVEEQFLTALRNAPAAFAKIGLDYIFLDVNDKFCQLTGYTQAELLGVGLYDITHPEDWDAGFQDMHRLLLDTSSIKTMERRFVRKDGSIIPVCMTITLIRDVLGQPDFFVLTPEELSENGAQGGNDESVEEESLSDFFDNASFAMHWVKPDGIIWRANKAELALLGYAKDEYVGHYFGEFHVDQETADDLRDRLLGNEIVENYPARLRAKDGSIKHVLISANFYQENGKLIHTRCFTQDVTALYESEQRYATMLETSIDGIWDLDFSTDTIYCNDRAYELTGLTRDELPVVTLDFFWSLVHPDDVVRTKALFQAHLDKNKPYDVEFRLRHVSGEYRYVHSRGGAMRDAFGQPVRMLGFITDITERKENERALRKSELRWYQLANATPSFIWVSRQDGWLSYANDQWCKHTGLTQEESCGYGWRNAIHPDDLERIAHVWDTPNEDGSFDAVELRYQTTSGAYRWLLARAYPIRDQDGNITEVYGVSTDIQDLKEAQATLKESEEHWRHLVNTVPVAVWTNDSQARLTYSNDRMFTYTGLTEEEFADPDWPRGIFHPDDYEPVWGSWLKAVAEGTPYEVELRYREKGGQKYRWAMTRAIPVRDENGAVQAWYGTTTDIDDLKQTQQALEESRSQWEQLANSIPALVWTASPDGRLTFQNKKWEEEFALPVEKALGFGWLDVLHPDDRERARKAWENTYKHGAPYQNEVRYLNKHGEYRWLFARATPVLDSEGRVVVWYGTCMDVHDLKVAQDTITESEERFRTMAESSPLMIWMSDETAALTYTNQHWRQFTGRDFDEMDAGRRFEGWDKLVHPDDIDRVLQRHKDAVLAHQPFEQEFRLLRYDGEYRWVIASGGPRFTNEGKFLGFTGSFIDITERKEVQHLLEESKENWRQLTNSIPAIVWLSDPQGNRTYFNDQLYKETGITSEEGLGDGWLKIVHPDDRERGLLFWQNAIRKEMPYEIELRYRNKDGDYRWHYSRGLPIRNSHGKVTAWCGTTLDIHDLKEAQHAVAESEERFRTMANAIPAAIWIARAEDAYVIYHNDQWQTMTGQPQEEALGYSWGSIIHPEDWERTLAAWSHAAQNETIYEVENRYLSASGEYRWVITRAVPVRDAQGNLLLYATSLDIDDLKKAQQAVIESEERFRMMAEAARFMITTINPAAEPIYMNKAWFEFTGYSMEEVAKAGWMKLLVHPNDWVRIESLIQEKFALREPFDMELRMRRYDGQYRWIYTLAAPRFSSSGEFVGYISSNLDITERKEAEEALQDYATRLERSNKELEHFAVIASHDLQAPLRKVQFFSDVLKESAAGQLNMESLDYLERMQRAAGRMQNLIDDLLDLSRVIRRGKPFEEMSLSDMMPGVLDEVYEQMKASHGRVEVGNMIDMVGDSSQIRQLLQNLIENGLKFHRPDVPPIVKVNSRILNSHELEITVEDNGIGFKEEYSEQIFETFRRLHSENAYPGTGIGLSLVKKIVERHGGRIEVQSEEGVGSLFRIILPILPSGKYKAE